MGWLAQGLGAFLGRGVLAKFADFYNWGISKMINNRDKFHDECGLIGIWNHSEAANLAYLGLYAQQHRGQEGAGVVSVDRDNGGTFYPQRGMGLVSEVFKDFDFSKTPGRFAIGHVRYSTAGGNLLCNVQPFHAEVSVGRMAVAHNGNLVNTDVLKKELIRDGAIFSSTSDTEIVLHLVAKSARGTPLVECVISALQKLQGAFSLLIMFNDRLIAARDAYGLRPLALAKLNDGVIVASETCAFDLLGATYLRDVEPGEVVEIFADGKINSYFPFKKVKATPCIFEYVYFARPDSSVFGKNVYGIRRQMGVELARESTIDADIVVPVPDSGMTGAIGFSYESKIPLELGLIRNHYVGRTFIEPQQAIRNFGVKVKLTANADVLRGKRIIVVDDSIVRGTTSRKIVRMLKKAGAKEVHMRISAPPTTDPCYYGVDTPVKEELIAANLDIRGVEKFIEADSLAYLSLDGLYRAAESAHAKPQGKFCDACFTGKYPAGTPKDYEKKQVELF